MSSEAEEDTVSKKRKLQRACDHCRRRKLKCDGPENANNRCSRCTTRNVDCTYFDAMQRITYPASYVEDLERRLERVEKMLEETRPEARQMLPETSGNTPTGSTTSRDSHLARDPAPMPIQDNVNFVEGSHPETRAPTPAEEHDDSEGLTEGVRRLSIDEPPFRYHGKHSALVLIHAIGDLKKRTLENEQNHEESRRAQPRATYIPYPWATHILERKMPIFQEYPPSDLLYALIDLYFRQVNDYTPLLHEFIFKKAVNSGLHLRDGEFGATVLLVCANGARFSSDTRVLLEGQDYHSAGWKWFMQVEEARRSLFSPAKLYDLQVYVLMFLFLQGTNVLQASWMLIGTAIRAVLDVGAHRRHMYSASPKIEEELWKRTIWTLVTVDWFSSYGLGRMPCISEEDIDIDLPTECDDEYWTTSDGQLSFSQPPDKPSKIVAFNCFIRLIRILSRAHRTVHYLNPHRATRSSYNQEQESVTELDSALNSWLASLPEYLRWDPDRVDPYLLTQSATLFAFYYQCQISVHRPLVRARSKSGAPSSFPSLIICMNAARSCVHVTYALHTRMGNAHHRNMGMIFMSALMLLLNVWSERRSERTISGPARDLALVQKSVEMLRAFKKEMHISEIIANLLEELMASAKPPTSSPSRGAGGDRSSHTTQRPADSLLRRSSLPTNTSGSAPSTAAQSSQQNSAPPPLPAFGAAQLGVQTPQQGPGTSYAVNNSPTASPAQGVGYGSPTSATPEGRETMDVGFISSSSHGQPLPRMEFLGPGAEAFAVAGADVESLNGGHGQDAGMEEPLPDFSFMDDMMSMWTTGGVPTLGTIEWDSWLDQVTGGA